MASRMGRHMQSYGPLGTCPMGGRIDGARMGRGFRGQQANP